MRHEPASNACPSCSPMGARFQLIVLCDRTPSYDARTFLTLTLKSPTHSSSSPLEARIEQLTASLQQASRDAGAVEREVRDRQALVDS